MPSMASAPRRSARARRPLPQPADGATASTSELRRSARARRPPPRLADSDMASASAQRRTARARRPLPPPSDRARASTSARRRSARGPAARTFYPDEIWEEIFLRLDAAADLARAAAACSTFRRIVSERQFLRRFRSLHSPPVLGFLRYGSGEFLPVGPPHRSAPEAHALKQAADFTFSFLPDRHAWRTKDARDGRVLLSRFICPKTYLWDFVVCDPLHRRYVKIPRIPDDLLAASAADNAMAPDVLPVLAPGAENDGEESFRFICTRKLQLEGKFMAFVFSSCNQTWRAIISTAETACVPNSYIQFKPSYAHGCFYWRVTGMSYSLMLDTSEMKFSIIDLPSHNFDSRCAMFEAANGKLGFLTIGDGTMNLYWKSRQNNGVGAQEWQHGKVIPLPISRSDYTWSVVGTIGRYVAFRVSANWYEMQDYEYFVLDIKTFLVEKLCTSNNDAIFGFPYARFPPPLVPPSI